MENPGRVYSREQLLDSVWGHGIYVNPEQLILTYDDLEKRLIQKEPKTLSEQFAQQILYRRRIKSLSLSC